MGGDEEKPAKLYEFLDQMKTEVISSNNISTESIDTLASLVRQKDGDIAALAKNLKESEEKCKQLSLKLSKSEADLRQAQESLRKPPSKPVPEESKTQEVA